MSHDEWMRRALELAERGRGTTSPNPVVGCVIVRDGVQIAEGYHARYGGPHAEAAALASADSPVTGATLYCTLEPCTFVGKTPPCVDAVIASGISTVVIAMRDPNPRVNGQGVERMRAAGITVVEGVLEEECRWANRGFIMVQRTRRPWIIGKVAQTLDGLVNADGPLPRTITGDAARAAVHATRATVDAIIVGARTVTIDDPLLTVRDHRGKTPARVILDAELETSPNARLFTTIESSPVIIFTTEANATSARAVVLRDSGALIRAINTDGTGLSLSAVVDHLCAHENVLSVLVESGGELLHAFASRELMDELHVYVAPTTAGGGTTWMGTAGIPGAEQHWSFHSITMTGTDARLCAIRTASKEKIS